jgi:hypothetical protein
MIRRHLPRSGRRYEAFLDGSHADDSALSTVLEAARAPGTREDMAGLPAARNAFMSVPYLRTRPAASVSRLPAATRTAAGRLLALKFVAAVSGVTLVGGAAYAATGAQLLGGSSPHRHSTSSAAPAPHNRGNQIVPPGQAPPTPGGPLPQPRQQTRHDDGAPNGNSSVAHSEHSPSNPATPPERSNTPHPPTSHAPKPHETPTPHDSKSPHTPSPHTSSPPHGSVAPSRSLHGTNSPN